MLNDTITMLNQEQQQEQQEYQQQDQQELQDQQEYKEEQEHKEEQEYQQQDQQQPEQIYDMRSRSQDLVWTDHEYTMLQLQQQPQQQQQITDQLSSKRQDFNTIQNDNEIIQQQHYSELPILENIDRHLTLPPPQQQQHGSQITTEGEAVLQLQQQQQQEDYHNYDNHQQQYYPDALALEVSEVENNLNKNICERTFFEKSVLSKIQEDLDKILRDTRDEHSIFISFRDVVSYDNNKLVSTVIRIELDPDQTQHETHNNTDHRPPKQADPRFLSEHGTENSIHHPPCRQRQQQEEVNCNYHMIPPSLLKQYNQTNMEYHQVLIKFIDLENNEVIVDFNRIEKTITNRHLYLENDKLPNSKTPIEIV
nr:probable basic-leucine zipper transcription factor K [Penaeus vannamei]